MTTVYDVPPNKLIDAVADELKTSDMIEPPEWSRYVKTGVHKVMPPVNPDWWYVRSASVLRRIYLDGPVGVSRLRTFYGGKYRRTTAGSSFVKGSGSILREVLQQLEKAGYVKKIKKGRTITPTGQSFLDNTAHQVKLVLQESVPELERY